MLAPLSNNPWSTANDSLTHPTMAQRGGREAIREGQTTPHTMRRCRSRESNEGIFLYGPFTVYKEVDVTQTGGSICSRSSAAPNRRSPGSSHPCAWCAPPRGP